MMDLVRQTATGFDALSISIMLLQALLTACCQITAVVVQNNLTPPCGFALQRRQRCAKKKRITEVLLVQLLVVLLHDGESKS